MKIGKSWVTHILIRIVFILLFTTIIYFVFGGKDAPKTSAGLPVTSMIVIPIFLVVLFGEAFNLFRKRQMDKVFCNLVLVLLVVFSAFFVITG